MSTINKILVFISIALAGFAALITFYTEIIWQRPLPIEEQEHQDFLKMGLKAKIPKAFIIKKLIINLNAPTTRLRYLEATIHLIPFKDRLMPFIEAHEASVKDQIIDIAGKMSPGELNSVAGKILLEERVKKQINTKLGGDIIKEILFSSFVIN